MKLLSFLLITYLAVYTVQQEDIENQPAPILDGVRNAAGVVEGAKISWPELLHKNGEAAKKAILS